MRKISEIHDIIADRVFIVKIYRDSEWGEYVCRLFVDGAELTESSYHTDDSQDALETGARMLGFYRMRADMLSEGVI